MTLSEQRKALADAKRIFFDLQIECKPISVDNQVWAKLYSAKRHIQIQIDEIMGRESTSAS